MSDVFLSYAQKDAARAHAIADTLSNAGLNVWWDTRLRPGGQFEKEIKEQIAAAKAVVVLWSSNSVDSP